MAEPGSSAASLPIIDEEDDEPLGEAVAVADSDADSEEEDDDDFGG